MDYATRDALVLEALAEARLRGSWWRTNCPFCEGRVGKADRDKCLSIHAGGGGYTCFRCRSKGRVRLPGSHVVEAAATVRMDVDVIDPPPGFVPVGEGAGLSALSLEPARAYLRSRGLEESIWQAAGIGACATGPYAGRVVVPVLADDGRSWVGFSARLWTAKCDKRLKYRNAVGEWKSRVVYNAAALSLPTDEPVYVVEGVFDALAHWPHAVAVLGDATDQQASILATACRPVVVVPDGDAWQKGWSLAMRLRLAGVEAGAIQLPAGVDPDEVDGSWLWETAREALS